MNGRASTFIQTVIGAISVTLLLSGCSSTVKPSKDPVRKTFTVSYRPYAPQPVYNRLRWVYLPDVVPAKNISDNEARDDEAAEPVTPEPELYAEKPLDQSFVPGAIIQDSATQDEEAPKDGL